MNKPAKFESNLSWPKVSSYWHKLSVFSKFHRLQTLSNPLFRPLKLYPKWRFFYCTVGQIHEITFSGYGPMRQKKTNDKSYKFWVSQFTFEFCKFIQPLKSFVWHQGMRFARMQYKLGLMSILRKFEVLPSASTPYPLEIDPTTFFLAAKGNVHVRLARLWFVNDNHAIYNICTFFTVSWCLVWFIFRHSSMYL